MSTAAPNEEGNGGMQIAYAVRDAEFEGKGLFSTEKIAQGTLIWRFRVGDNVTEYDEPAATKHLETLTMPEAKDFLDLTYGIRDKLCFIRDDGRFMNHSTQPNCITDMSTGNTYALRDIEPDEQLFEDYARFEHPAFLFPLLEKYQCAPNYYEIPADVYPDDKKLRSKSTSTCSTNSESIDSAADPKCVTITSITRDDLLVHLSSNTIGHQHRSAMHE
jgi:SET domain-containing protein